MTTVVIKTKSATIEQHFINREAAAKFLASSLKEMDVVSYEVRTSKDG